MRAALIALPLCLSLVACNIDPSGGASREAEKKNAPSASLPARAVDPLAAHDPASGGALEPTLADDKPRPLMQLQVVLDRLGFTPGVVDGKEGQSTRNAIAGFQEARSLPISGELDDATRQALAGWNNIPATRLVTIPADFAAGPFVTLPHDPAAQAKLPALGYQSLDEKLAERFHTTPETLRMLNPAPASPGTSGAADTNAAVSTFHSGQQIRLPNVGADRIDDGMVPDAPWRDTLASLGVGTAQPQAAKIVVSKSEGTLKAYDAAGKLVGMYTATMGSQHDPLPIGKWKVVGVARNPDFAYDPALFWDGSDNAAKQKLPPGPNGPVGVAWIDIDKKHYGIHGTPEPSTIGQAESHGCVRLTNWDVARLAQMVKPGTQVLFET
ncbi:L,D-transpeptidase family protein [Novosphingobium sp. G106]|uniref:L,D-transpeptidase family protein n=1 Tax=Novosphingobium sp. G106 TaxID=2849500 RepID=UPI001C2DD8A5|nr:L,D-transpeptidase family protein [Novosphingobium sp. G106]MBV1688451.1 L,D-transpeptidase family protein [Novosphingobium sp. G106]